MKGYKIASMLLMLGAFAVTDAFASNMQAKAKKLAERELVTVATKLPPKSLRESQIKTTP